MSAQRDNARESPAVREGVIAAIMAGFVAFVLAAAVGLFFFYKALAHNTTFAAVHAFPSPQLQTRSDGLRDPEIAKQQAELDQFRWIDHAHGVFQIPIERAMRLVAARGARAYEPVPPASGARPAQASDGTGR